MVNGFGTALQQYETEFSRLQAVLRDSGLLARPEPLREFVYWDVNVMISVIQQHDYQHGAWIVRMQAKTLEHENALEDAGLTFPELEGRVFLPGSLGFEFNEVRPDIRFSGYPVRRQIIIRLGEKAFKAAPQAIYHLLMSAFTCWRR